MTSALGDYSYYAINNQSVSGCRDTSSVFNVTVINDPTASASPINQSTCVNGSLTPLQVTAVGGSGTTSYQWYYTTNGNNTGGTVVSGATNSSYSPPVSTVYNRYYYVSVTQSSPGCQINSTTGQVIVAAAGSVQTQPVASQTICSGGIGNSLTFVATGGNGTISYQWYINSINSATGGTTIAGAIQSNHQPIENTTGTYYYYCIASFSNLTCLPITSNVSTLIVVDDPTISANPISSQTICIGGSLTALSTTLSGGTGSTSYQWYVNTLETTTGGTAITGATSSSYNVPVPANSGLYYYYLIGSKSGNGCTPATSSLSTIEVLPDPTLAINLTQQTICIGGSFQPLEVTVTNPVGASSYQWYYNTSGASSGGSAVSGGTGITINPTGVNNNWRYYYCTVSSSISGCNVNSPAGGVYQGTQPSITTQPQASQTICAGGSPNPLSVIVSSSSVLQPQYNWYFNETNSNTNGQLVSTSNSNSFSPTIDSIGNYYYYSTIHYPYSGCSSLTSNIAAITAQAAFTITTAFPNSQTICTGGSPSNLSVSVNGGAGTSTYQWFNATTGSSISGATASTYSPTLNSAGVFSYYVRVTQSTSGCNTVYSDTAFVEVVADPVISTQPLAGSYCVNATAVPLTVAYTGGVATVTYDWYSNTTNSTSGGTVIVSGGSSSYTPPTNVAGSKYYYCKINSPSGSGCSQLTSTPINVYVGNIPSVQLQPSNFTLCSGGTITNGGIYFNLSGSGFSTSYQWYINNVNSNVGGTPISGANAAQYNPPLNFIDTNYYYAVATFSGIGCGVLASAVSIITVNPDPTFTTQPTPTQSICVGGSPSSLSVVTSGGAGTTAYQWFSNTTNSTSGGSPISGTNSPNYSPPTINTVSTKYYYCSVSFSGIGSGVGYTNGCSSATSSVAVVQVLADPTITTQPLASQSVCLDGSPSNLTVAFTGGAGTATYDWRCNNSNTTSGGTAVGNNTGSLTPPVSATGTKYYHCDITFSGSGCSAISSTNGTVTVVTGPSFTTQPLISQVVCQNGTTSALTVAYSGGSGTATRQWYSNNTNSYSGGTSISGATGLSYTPPSNVVGTKYYYCRVTFSSGTCNIIYSSTAQVTVNQAVSITTQTTASQSVCVGGSPNPISITLNATNLNTTYNWYVNSTNTFTGATVIANTFTPTYTPTANTPGNYYYFVRAQFTNAGCSSVTSTGALVSVAADPSITTQPTSATICTGGNPQPLNFVSQGGTGAATYQWFSNTTANNSNGTTIVGANSTSYDPPAQVNTGNLYYYAQVSFAGNGCNSVNTNPATIIVTADPSISTQPISNQTVCLNGNAQNLSITLPAIIGSATYNWFYTSFNSASGGALVSSAGSSFEPPTSGLGLAYYYCRVDFTGAGCSSLTSNVASVNTIPLPAVIISATELTACDGYNTQLAVTTDADIDNSNFTWYLGSSASNILPVPNTNNTNVQIAFSGTAMTYVYGSVTNENGCINYSDTCVVRSLAQPEINAIFPANQKICLGGSPDPLACSINSVFGNSSLDYFLSANPYTYDGLPLGSSGSNLPDFNFPTERTFFAVYQLNFPNCIADTSDFAVITAYEDPVINFTDESATIACINQGEIEVNIETSNTELSADYTWFVGNSTYDTGTTLLVSTQNVQPSSQEISVTAIYEESGCDTAYTPSPLNITFIPQPTLASYIPEQNEICIFDQLTDSIAINLSTEVPSTLVQYQWYINVSEDYQGAFPIENALSNSYKPNSEQPGSFYYFCEVNFDSTYCSALQSAISSVNILPPSEFCFETLEIPNAISPNGDNFNDSWDVSYLGIYGTYKVNVWNQYGQLIFAGNEQSVSWDGKYQGQNVPVGDYYYQIEIPMVNRTFSGTIGVNY
jgi:gliding motility-associated-like protein